MPNHFLTEATRHIVWWAMLLAAFPSYGAGLELVEHDDVIKISSGGKPVLEYVKTEKVVPEGLDQHYRRSGYIHPVYSPSGHELSGDFPKDHPHQHALFFAWTKTAYEGAKIDFWNLAKEQGRVEHRGVQSLKRGEGQVSFTVKHAFVAGTGESRVDVLNETWTVTVYQTPGDYFLFDIESRQECAGDKTLLLDKYHYGGMAFRANSRWIKEKGDHGVRNGDLEYLTSGGKNRWDGNHTRADWVSFSGKIDQQVSTVTVMGSPLNFRAPQHVRIHPNKPYFCFAPMVSGKFEIEPGMPYISRYRYLVTAEKPDNNMIRKHWASFKTEADNE